MNKLSKILIGVIVVLVIALATVTVLYLKQRSLIYEYFGNYEFSLGGNNEKTLDINVANQTLANSTPFNELATMDVTTEELGTVMGINTENVENVVGKIPMMNVQASMYLLVQAKDGAVDTVKSELDNYLTQYEEQWSRYLPEQYTLVQNRIEGTVGNTIYVIIAENADTLEQEITK